MTCEIINSQDHPTLCLRNVISDNIYSIGGFDATEIIYNNIVRGECHSFLNLDARCSEQSQSLRNCTSARILLNEKSSMASITKMIANNIKAESLGCDTYEVRYDVIMRHDDVLNKM